MMRLRNLMFVLVALGGCSDDPPAPRGGSATQLAEPDSELDQPLMIALSEAKNFHHMAKVYMSDGDLDDAIAAVRSILAIKFPDGAPEGEDVRMDAHAMLAKLILTSGKPEDAMKEVDAALKEKTRDSFFVANLYTVKGEIFEAQAADVEGDAAHKRKLDAIDAYTTSNQINEALQKKLYEDLKGAK